MRYIRTSGPSMLRALKPIASALDACWWYIGGSAVSITRDFRERAELHSRTTQQIEEHFMHLLERYVEVDTADFRIGRPGFFSHLSDALDFNWDCHFVLEGEALPLTEMSKIETLGRPWYAPYEGLPEHVILVARDIDGSYQEYGFRDDWMFWSVLGSLRQRGYAADEVTDWPVA